MQDLHDFLEPLNLAAINFDRGYDNDQLGAHVLIEDAEAADIIIVGINEFRGSGSDNFEPWGSDAVRRHFYRLHYWHTDIIIGDIGNIITGASLADSLAALRTVLEELFARNKTVIILGGSHDITLAQYDAYRKSNTVIEATCIDSEINLRGESNLRSENFLMDMFTAEPNILKHYNHIGFQSYYVHPQMLQTIDKLRFDCFRLGTVLENIEETEPVLRQTDLLSFDIGAVKFSDAPCNKKYPNGFTGIEACTLTRFAGMSSKLSSFGLYGYRAEEDIDEVSAAQIAQMLWYFIDGRHRRSQEPDLKEREHFNEFHTALAEVDTIFLQSKRSNRWWMQMPDGKFIACSEKDYITAGNNDYPERWLRVQERG